MTEEEFEKVVEDTLIELKNILIVKGKEYRRNSNPFHNFEIGALKKSLLREEILDGFRLKHIISIDDMRQDLYVGKKPTKETVKEKFNDTLVYYIIEKAMFLENSKDEK